MKKEIERKDIPLVTVITPAYNRADLLPETIESVLSQDYPNIQYIVLDDGSTDNTLEVINRYADRLIAEAHPNMGETETVNKAFRMAEGEFICVVNSDDPILPGAITKMVLALMAEPEALAVYPDWVEIDPQSRPIKEMRLPDYDISSMLKDFNVALGPGNTFRASVLEKYGFRDTKRRYTGDLEFWFRLASHGKLVHIPEVLATHRTHPDSASVSQKGSRMAVELVSIAGSLFWEGHLPPELMHEKKSIMAQVYYVASFYCPGEPFKKANYLLLALFANSRVLFDHLVRNILSAFVQTGVFLLQVIKFVMRVTLPGPVYRKILSWWMGFKEKITQTQESV